MNIRPGTAELQLGDDIVTARRYRHPALGDRPTVRLVPQTLGEAEDLSAEFLGFAAPERIENVGTGRREALGFPAWALVNDPANAHHALNLVKDIERLARVAKAKPGAAKDGFVRLAEMLGRSAPHFLPTFYEQAGRIFVDTGSATTAATMFGKAREAEAVHNLKTVPEHQKQVFLEFAFAGALTAKALTNHAKALAGLRTPAEAFDEFSTLCVERIRGGLPPYTGMPEDLRKLAKAAGENLAASDQALLRAVIGTPAISKAGHGFWKAYQKSLVALAKADAEVRGQLLGFIPDDKQAHAIWIAILEESGAATALTEPADNVGAPAAWLSRFASTRAGHWRRAGRLATGLAFVTAMTGRLRADEVPVDLPVNVDLDLLDLCMAERVPLVGRQYRFDIQGWLEDAEPGRRDLVAVAGDLPAELGEGLANTYLGRVHTGKPLSAGALAPVLAVPGLRTALKHWLETKAEQVHEGSLVTIRQVLWTLRPVETARAFVDAPAAIERIASTDLAAALAKSLNAGIFDEYGWPALDEAVALLLDGADVEPGSDSVVSVAGEGWPVLVLRREHMVVAVGPDGVLLQHVLRIPPELKHHWYNEVRAFYVDGRLVVLWQGPENAHGYWSDAPDTVLSAPGGDRSWSYRAVEPSLPMPGGGRFTGRRVLHPGDTAWTDRPRVHSDGTSYWALPSPQWTEVDPATGTLGRHSLPTWIESFAADDTKLDLDASWLRPGADGGPLGQAGGMLGWRVRKEADGGWVGERVDGRQARLTTSYRTLVAAMEFPGAEALRPVSDGWNTLTIHDPAGTAASQLDTRHYRPVMAEGTALVPPLAWWSNLRVRDEAGSRALRSITPDIARKLLAGGSLTELLPEITHPELAKGVQGMVGYVRRYLDLSPYQAMAAESAPAETEVDEVSDIVLHQALCWTKHVYRRTANEHQIVSFLRALPAVGDVDQLHFNDWYRALANPAAVAWRAASSFTPPEHRTALIAFLRAVAASDITNGRWRGIEATASGTGRQSDSFQAVSADQVTVAWSQYNYRVGQHSWVGLQYATGSFTLPDGWKLGNDWPIGPGFDSHKINSFCDALEANGPLPWQPELADVVAADTGLSVGEAALLLAGLPGVQSYETNYLGTETRNAIGLSTAVAKFARERFRNSGERGNLELLGTLIPADPATLWTSGPDLTALAEKWVARFGRRVSVPDALLADAKKQLQLHNPAEAVSGVANAESCAWLTTDARMFLHDNGVLGAKVSTGFQGRDLVSVRNVLPWLAYHLPAGSPLRAQLPRALELARDRLQHPELLFQLGNLHDWDSAKQKSALLTLLRLPPDSTGEVDVDGWLTLRLQDNNNCNVFVRPSGYRPEHWEKLLAICDMMDYRHLELHQVLPEVLGDGIAAACALTKPEDVDPDAYYQDPALSVPDLVETVAARYTVDTDVAALYLQLLALPDPTDANVARWTGWKPARLRKARTALAETDLVLSAKRARAGRSLFLPGGWLAFKSPHLPIETWKGALFGFTDAAPPNAIVPLGTVEQLFRQAWARIEDGDIPTYEELRT